MLTGYFLKDPNSLAEYDKIYNKYPYFLKKYSITIVKKIQLDESQFNEFCSNFKAYNHIIDRELSYLNEDLIAICYEVSTPNKNIVIYFYSAGHNYPRYVSVSHISNTPYTF